MDQRYFTTAERWLLGVLGVLCGAGAGLVWSFPGTRTVVAAQCPGGQATSVVSADPTAIAVALLGVAGLFLFVAVNGRRLANLKLPGGIEASALQDETKAVQAALPGKLDKAEPSEDEKSTEALEATPSTTVVVNGVELGVFRLDDVPTSVLRDLFQTTEQLPSRFAVDFIARKVGRGNNPWLIRFRGDERIWRIAYGGQGKGTATVSVIA